ncbi:MAG TPA: peptide ABC transporter substrate-binding protein, partial [Ktedonobacteraceae bacterium]|nr:peptide ABC transporter substrate-binding protein [Ktedonobacteraceae bacterium]
MSFGKKLTSGVFPALLCLVAMLMVACGSTPGTGGSGGNGGVTKAPQSQQIYVYPEAGVADIATFDPGLSTDLPSIAAIDMVFTGLVQLDDDLKIHAQEAQSWSEGSDGLTWTFHLRPNLKFSDGTPLTSADVAYSIDRALQPAEKSTVGPIYLALIKDSDKLVAGKIKTVIGDSVMTPDPNTVVLVTNKKASYFLDALTYSCSYTLEKSLVDKYGKNFTDHLTEGGGNGPWKVSAYNHGQEIDFVPNANYYGPKPQLSMVKFPFYKQADTTYRAYQVGQVDTAGVPSANLNEAKALPNGQFHQVPQLWINYYNMNYLVKPFDNIKIRQAFELAVNKDLIVHSVWKDTMIPTNHIVPKGQPGYYTGLKGPDGTQNTSGNPTMAKQLFQQGMQEEGWSSPSQVPAITLYYPSGSKDSDNEVAALQQMWQSTLGISIKAQPTDFNKLLDDITAATNNPHGIGMWG